MKSATFGTGICLIILMWGGIPIVSAENFVSNGGFESSGPIPASPGFLTVPPGTLNDWTVVSGNIQVIGSKYWAPQSGSNSIDLAGTVPGAINQSIPTVPGGNYTLLFWIAGNPNNQTVSDVIKGLEIYWDGNALHPNQTFNVSGKTRTNMGWVLVRIDGLNATNSSTVLEFENIFPNDGFGVALDDIAVVPYEGPVNDQDQISVITPNGGETWSQASVQTIEWGYSGDPGENVKILLYKGALLDSTIVESTSIGTGGIGSFTWQIPPSQSPENDYRIQVTSTSNSLIYGISNIFAVSAQPDIWISDVKPVQVIFDSDINGDKVMDLVKGKETAIVVFIDWKGVSNPDNYQISFNVHTDRDYSTESIKLSDLKSSNGKYVINVGTYDSAGKYPITTTLKYNVIGSNIVTEIKNVTTVDVKSVNPQKLAFYGITTPESCDPNLGDTIAGCYFPLDHQEYADTTQKSSDFIRAVYPLGRDDLTIERDFAFFPGSYSYTTPIKETGLISIDEDLIALSELNFNSNAKAIGVVPSEYFTVHQMPGTWGWDVPALHNVALSTVSHYVVPAHELGHIYGLNIGNEEYDSNPPSGKTALGFDVTKIFKSIDNNDQTFLTGDTCFMGNGNSYLWIGKNWVCNETYTQLFQKFRTNPSDPSVMFIEGTIFENRTIVLGKTKWLSSGSADDVIAGDYSLIYIDSTGKVIDKIKFYDPHIAIAEPNGEVKLPIGVFGFTIPYPSEANTIQISDGNKILVEFNIKSKLLKDAINSIPDSGFNQNPHQVRNSLLDIVDEYEKLMEQGKISDAQEKLHSIRNNVEKFLIDSYQTSSPTEYTKEELIELIDSLSKGSSIPTPSPSPIPEFPSTFLPAIMIIGFSGAVLLIQRTRKH